MNNSCIVGYGTVGKATAEAFGITKYYSRKNKNMELEDIKNFKYVFVCLPTLVKEGKYQVNDIIAVLNKINEVNPEAIIILRSTIYPGFCKSIQKSQGIKNLVFNPEFLSEDTAIEDAKKPMLIVVGSDNPKARQDVVALYKGRFSYIEPVETDSITAEFIKICLNGFFSLKVIFANQIFDYAQNIGANYETFAKVVQAHPWGSKNHFQVFHKGGRGAGGKCLRKDLEALAEYSDSMLLESTKEINDMLLEMSGK